MSVLQHIGQIKRPYLTPLEEKLLSVLETVYEVETQATEGKQPQSGYS
ncbi:hypothetical protein H6G81_21530 [Scytonema hofmannii FACHB-248]|uniref:Uncharacterized protein n=1 Tax=Scytonema hofmannii FACHB-248 TaxID=1842502 RepID=A0ABR8GUJ8_9CYAN|nr:MULTISPECIES: hypothetical protein [Nostocales]MBD2607038.1 hypothetical protein [Scytonema hofmannii FACHB-248]